MLRRAGDSARWWAGVRVWRRPAVHKPVSWGAVGSGWVFLLLLLGAWDLDGGIGVFVCAGACVCVGGGMTELSLPCCRLPM